MLSQAEFDSLFESVKNWDRWGPADQRGTLNLITPERSAAAAALIRAGQTISLAHALNRQASIDNPRPALHYMSRLVHGQAGEPTFNMDFLGMDYHGKAVTHVDSFSHCAYKGLLYGGMAARDAVTANGATFGAVTNFAQGIVGRGVLLDMARFCGVDWLEPGTALVTDDLANAATQQAVAIDEGDVLLVRTGHGARRAHLGPWDPDQACAGVHVSAATWLHERGVAVLGSDADSDVRPSPVDGVHTPVHVLALAAMGMPLLDNMQLDDLGEACARQNRWEFLFMAAPLRVPGGTGSPLNPLAVL